MKLKALRSIILNSKGGHAPLDSAHRLLKKINLLEKYSSNMLTQFHNCREKGDFTGRVFEKLCLSLFPEKLFFKIGC